MVRSVPSAWCGTSGALALALVALACGGDPYAGRADVAAEAGQATLAPAELTAWVARVPGRAPTRSDAAFTALTWIDFILLAQASSSGTPLLDSATAAQALVPDLTLVPLRKWHDTLVARRPRIAASVPDSLYAEDGIRVFQEIFLKVRDPEDVRAISALRESADSLLEMAQGTRNFAALARARSEDAAGRGGGWLAPGRRGSFPPDFAQAAWRIKPGEIAGVLSRGGFHVVRRPPVEEVRGRLRVYAESLATRRADSVYADSLNFARGLTLGENVPTRLRAFFADPSVRARDTAPLARWATGQLTLQEATLWIDLLPPHAYLELRGTSDVLLERFTWELGQQKLMQAEALSHGLAVSPTEWAALFDGYKRSVAAALTLIGADPNHPVPPDQAGARVKALVDGFTSDSTRYRRLPSALAAVLRGRSGYRLHDRGIAAALAGVPRPAPAN